MSITPFHGYTDDELREMRSVLADCEGRAHSNWPGRLYRDATSELTLRRRQREQAQRLCKMPLSRATHLFKEVAGEVESSSPYVEYRAH